MSATGAYVALLITAPVILLGLLVWAGWPQYRPHRPLDVTPEAQLRRLAPKLARCRPERIERGGQVMANRPVPPRAQRFPPRGYRGSDSLNPAPVRSVDSMTPEEQAQSARYSDTDFDD